MRGSVRQLAEHVSVRCVAHQTYVGTSVDLGWGRVYGGQVLAQALSAAYAEVRLVEQPLSFHSSHSYFVRPGDVSRDVEYRVSAERDGGSFSFREIVATQGEHEIFRSMISFNASREDEVAFSHQNSVASHTEVPSQKLRDVAKFWPALPKAFGEMMLNDMAIDFRPIGDESEHNPALQSEAKSASFLRLNTSTAAEEKIDRHAQHAMLLYASDFGFLPTSLRPFGVPFYSSKLQVASLCHSFFLHDADVDFTKWLCFENSSPISKGARGLVVGEIFQEDALIASVTQEGLIRIRDPNGLETSAKLKM